MKNLLYAAVLLSSTLWPVAGESGPRTDDASAELVVAKVPSVAVQRAAQKVLGVDRSVRVRTAAFEGLPIPSPGVRFAARALNMDETSLRFTVHVEARTARGVVARRTYVFPCEVDEAVVVPKETIRAGQTIRSEDLEVRTVGPEGYFDRYALTLDELVGHVARRTLLAGRPVARRSVERPTAVDRGSQVTVRVHLGPMVVTMEGEAMEAGAVGETVKVLNPRSKRVLSGRVVDHGTVEVMR